VSEDSPPRYLRLLDNHPTMVKLNKLAELADELGITILFSSHTTVVYDNEFPNPIEMYDADHGSEYPVSDFPPTMEFVLRYENPEYIKLKEEERIKFEEERVQREKAKQEEIKRKAAEDQRRRELETTRIEMAELARLKEKYGDSS